jgi:hypothetical protein
MRRNEYAGSIVNNLFLLLIFSLPFVQPINPPVSTSFVQITDLIFLAVAGLSAVLILTKKLSFRFDLFTLFSFFICRPC